MYDSVTAGLIRSAPPLEGLDLDDLPRQLTEAYASIVSHRLRLATAEAAEESPAEITEATDQLAGLARTYEAYVVSLEEDEHRKSAAFVAPSFISSDIAEAGTGAGGEDRDDLPARDDHGCTRTIARGEHLARRLADRM